MQRPFRLDQALTNYLKYMDFVKTSASLTLKAYKKDLEQAFGPFDQPENQRSFTENELLTLFSHRIKPLGSAEPFVQEPESRDVEELFGWAYQEKMTDRDLALQIVCPKVPKKLPHFLSVDEALAVLRSYDVEKDEDIGSLKDKALFLVLYGGGLRVSEACNLRWRDIQFSARSLRLVGKGQKERLVVVPAMAVKVLRRLQESSEGEFVFGEVALNPRVAYDWVRKRGAKALLMKPLHPHALRHSFATHLLGSGANLRTLQEMLGHESLQATEKYTHLGVDQLARTLESHHPLSGTLGKRKI